MYASTTTLMIIFAFAFFPLILAEIARNKSMPTVEDFFLQSRKMSTFFVFFTVYSTWMSAFAFLGASAYFYCNGPVYLTAIGWDALFGVLFMVVGKRIWFYGRQRGYITPTDFFHDIYNSRLLDTIVTLVMICFTLLYLQIQLYGGAYLIEIATNGVIPWRICGLLFYLIIIIYLWAGGLRAVAMTDVFYGICLILAMFTVGIFLIHKAGGMEYVFREIAAENQQNLILPGPSGNAGAWLWISMFFIVPIGALMGPQMWVRAYAAEKKKTFGVIPLLICLVSIQCFGTLFAGNAGILLAPGVERADTIIPVLLIRYGTPILCALLFCGIASAALSTANSQIHAISAVYTQDIHRKYINPSMSQKGLVGVGKWAVLMISAGAYLLFLRNPALIVDTGAIALGGTSQIFVPTLGALFWKRSHEKAACAGIVVGLIVLILFGFHRNLNASYGALLALACNGLIFSVGSLLLKPNKATRFKIEGYKREFDEDRLN